MAMPRCRSRTVLLRLPRIFCGSGGAVELTCVDVLPTGRYTSFVNTAKKPIFGLGREKEWTDTANLVWSEVAGLCGFWDGVVLGC